MAAPRAISGNQGSVKVGGSTIAEVTKHDGTIDYGVKTYTAQSGVSGGVGYQKTVLGNAKCSGTIEGLFDPSFAPGSVFNKGALVSLELHLNSGSYVYLAQARISTRTFGADINAGDPIPFTATFESDGVIAENSI